MSKIKLLAAISILALFALVSCTSGPISALSPASAPSQATADVSNTGASIDFVSAVESVRPAVVAIEVQLPAQGVSGQPQRAAGSGWIIDSNGLIVTNEHVVANATTITIALVDGRKFTSKAVQTSPDNDLAVVKIDARNLPVASIGDSSNLKLAQPVAIIGNALDLGIRVTTGVVSLLDVSITYQNNLSLSGLIETDAPINPGNSGGVLVNMSGEVVGITNAGLEGPSIDIEGFGYAISINEAMPVIKDLMSRIP